MQDALTSITKLECRYQHLDSATQGFVNAVSSFRQLIDTGFVGQFKQQQQQQQLITLIGSLIVKSLRKIKSIHDSGSGRATIGQVQNWSHTSLLIKQVLSPIQPKLSITVDEKLEIDKLLNGSYMSMSAQARNPQTVEARSGSRNGILPKLPLPTKSTEPQQRNSTSPLFIKTKTAAPLSTLSSVTNGNNDHACSQQVKSRPDFDHPAVSEFTKTPNQLLRSVDIFNRCLKKNVA